MTVEVRMISGSARGCFVAALLAMTVVILNSRMHPDTNYLKCRVIARCAAPKQSLNPNLKYNSDSPGIYFKSLS
jgi:hypothetical protein